MPLTLADIDRRLDKIEAKLDKILSRSRKTLDYIESMGDEEDDDDGSPSLTSPGGIDAGLQAVTSHPVVAGIKAELDRRGGIGALLDRLLPVKPQE